MPIDVLADVAVDAFAGADPVFTYRVPDELRAFVQPGQLVWAPLRRQRVQGVVLHVYAWDDPPLRSSGIPPASAVLADPKVIRDLIDLADPEAALTPAQLRLARWVSETYRAPLYECLSLMLPTGVSQESEPTWRASADGFAIELGTLPEKERAILYFLRRSGETSEHDLRDALRGSDAELRELYAALFERGLALRGARLSSPKARPRLERMVRLVVPLEQAEQAITTLTRSPKQRAALATLAALAAGGEEIPASAVYQAGDADLAALRALEKRELVALGAREVRRDPLANLVVPADIPPTLSIGQERIWRELSAALDLLRAEASEELPSLPAPLPVGEGRRKQFLLHGVTGSGKTELYLRAIARALRMKRQTLVLVPEIALTTQLVRRFAARFPGKLAVLHSGLSDGERYDEWRRLRRGDAWVAIGSRSAVFAPLPSLGVVIVDEEHESTYKHDGAPRYHARDAARQLAELTGAVLILGSATPSVETYAAAQSGELQLLELLERVGGGRDAVGLPRSEPLPLPPVQIVDMRRELQSGNRSIFSRPLQQALAETLDRSEQAILFLNRRGAAAFVMCRDCGHVVNCPNCSAPLTLHYEEGQTSGGPRLDDSPAPTSGTQSPASLLVCHSCGHRELVPVLCPNCWSTRIKSFGVGTQRVVEDVAALFPAARILRWDRDTVKRRGDHGRMLDRFLDREADILVGTQMIAKGLDLPMVSLVGVVAADTGLYLPDFRAGERAFQLMTQVAGRAGRRSAGAKVVVQTYTPEHYALRAAQEHDYATFYAQEIAFRRATSYPPFSRLVRFVYASGSDDRGRREADRLAEEIRRLADALDIGDWGLVGPAPAFFHRVRNRFRWHVLLRATNPMPLLRHLRPGPGWVVDVDPAHVL
ncbi:MAG: primosomal protein N' [Roseiflexaceae bacterium]|nr:primosomal protein N' [Roseiflexaceae bacterium]